MNPIRAKRTPSGAVVAVIPWHYVLRLLTVEAWRLGGPRAAVCAVWLWLRGRRA